MIVILQHRIRPFVQLLQAFVDPPAPDPVQGFQIDGPFAPGRSLHRRLVHGTVRLPHIPGQKHIDRYGDRTVLVKIDRHGIGGKNDASFIVTEQKLAHLLIPVAAG